MGAVEAGGAFSIARPHLANVGHKLYFNRKRQ
jgi:hypothetical protein